MAREQEERERWAEEVEQMERTFSFLFLLPIHFRKISFADLEALRAEVGQAAQQVVRHAPAHLQVRLQQSTMDVRVSETQRARCSDDGSAIQRMRRRRGPAVGVQVDAAGGGRLWICRLGFW